MRTRHHLAWEDVNLFSSTWKSPGVKQHEPQNSEGGSRRICREEQGARILSFQQNPGVQATWKHLRSKRTQNIFTLRVGFGPFSTVVEALIGHCVTRNATSDLAADRVWCRPDADTVERLVPCGRKPFVTVEPSFEVTSLRVVVVVCLRVVCCRFVGGSSSTFTEQGQRKHERVFGTSSLHRFFFGPKKMHATLLSDCPQSRTAAQTRITAPNNVPSATQVVNVKDSVP